MKAKKSDSPRENAPKITDADEQEQSKANRKSASKVQASFPRGDVRYWRARVKKDPRTKNLFVQIAHAGERHLFTWKQANAEAVAPLALAVWKSVTVNGWPTTLAKFKPHAYKGKGSTVGVLIAAVTELADCRPDTLRGNVSVFRRIVADIEGIKADAARFARCGNGRTAWLAALDAVLLAKVTPDKIEAWKLRFVAKAAGDEIKARAARISANTMLRQGKSLFTKRLIPFLKKRLQLPDPLPFDGVKLFPRQHMRYASQIDVKALLTAATGELARTDPEAFKAFLLALFGGLRRNEADKLRWKSIDFAAGAIRVEAQADFAAKCETSLADVPIDSEVCALLQGLHAKEPQAEYVLKGDRSKVNTTWREYRAEDTFTHLAAWLRKHGVDTRSPVHTLRKEAGSIVCQKAGLFAASRFLRHADVAITAQHYASQKERVTLGFAGLLAPAENVTTADFTAKPKPAATGKGRTARARRAL